MNQIAICHNWTSKSSEQDSETLELWGLYFMSQSTQDSTLQSSELRKSGLLTYSGRFVCDFQRSPQDFYFCHSPSRGKWERDRVELTKIQSSRWLSQCQSTRWLMNDWLLSESRTISFVSAVTSFIWRSSLEIKAPCSLLDAVCQSFSTVDTAYYSFDGY